MSAGLHLHRTQNPVQVLPRSSFLLIPKETVFTQFLNSYGHSRRQTASCFEKHPTSPLSISQAQVFDTGVCTSRGCGIDPELEKTVTG